VFLETGLGAQSATALTPDETTVPAMVTVESA
jgi:hypothetical protein